MTAEILHIAEKSLGGVGLVTNKIGEKVAGATLLKGWGNSGGTNHSHCEGAVHSTMIRAVNKRYLLTGVV